MLPEDYEPYPEEEGYGDYPKFQAIHMENLSDHNLYDFPVLKRNFCEPVSFFSVYLNVIFFL